MERTPVVAPAPAGSVDTDVDECAVTCRPSADDRVAAYPTWSAAQSMAGPSIRVILDLLCESRSRPFEARAATLVSHSDAGVNAVWNPTAP